MLHVYYFKSVFLCLSVFSFLLLKCDRPISELSQDSQVPPAVVHFFLFKVIQFLLHISRYASVLSTKCLSAFSCISPHLRCFSVNRGSAR